MNAAVKLPAEVGATEMLGEAMENLIDALQGLSDRIAPGLGSIADHVIAPVLYDEPLADAIQKEVTWADALALRVREMLARV